MSIKYHVFGISWHTCKMLITSFFAWEGTIYNIITNYQEYKEENSNEHQTLTANGKYWKDTISIQKNMCKNIENCRIKELKSSKDCEKFQNVVQSVKRAYKFGYNFRKVTKCINIGVESCSN